MGGVHKAMDEDDRQAFNTLSAHERNMRAHRCLIQRVGFEQRLHALPGRVQLLAHGLEFSLVRIDDRRDLRLLLVGQVEFAEARPGAHTHGTTGSAGTAHAARGRTAPAHGRSAARHLAILCHDECRTCRENDRHEPRGEGNLQCLGHVLSDSF